MSKKTEFRDRSRKRSRRYKSPPRKKSPLNEQSLPQYIKEKFNDEQISDICGKSSYDKLKKLYMKKLVLTIIDIKRIYHRHAAKSALSAELECVNCIAKFII